MALTLGVRSLPVCQARDESTVNLVTQPRTAGGEAAATRTAGDRLGAPHGPGRRDVSSPILVVDSSEIRAGKLGEVKAGVEELVAFVEANEAEPLAYEIYFDEPGTLMTVVQIHPDSASLERHLTVAGPVFRRFADLLTLVRVDVYGKASEAALEQIRVKAQLLGDAPLVVHELHAGFSRFTADG
jgi:hypothetical protein